MNSAALAAGLRQLRGKLAAGQRSEESDEQLLHAFTSRRDDNAFTVLMHRHGPMVLHVCSRVLGHEQDAEDAFQAAFLVLAQSAASLRSKTSLASFLHGIAYRTAMKARQSAARRRKHEGAFPRKAWERGVKPPADPAEDLSWREVRALLDEEIARLPEIYRSVFVLCCLEGLSRADAAQRLGLKECTVFSRLAEARKRLSKRLARRGVELTAVLATTALAAPSASALPVGLTVKTIQAALATVAGENLAGIVSASVAELVKGATTAMMVGKAKIASVVLLTGMLLGAAGWAWSGGFEILSGGRQPAERSETQGANAPRSAKHEAAKTVEIHGRVLGPDGKPKAGAKLALLGMEGKVKQIGVSAEDGHFSVIIPNERDDGWSSALLAYSPDAGLDFISLAGRDAAKPAELRLVKDQVIRGRVVNTEGKPIRNVRVSVGSIDMYSNNSLESFFVLWQKRPADYALPPGEKTLLFRASSLLGAVTDANGRFAISGVGAERVAELYLREGGIAHTTLRIVNRNGFDPKTFNRPADDAYRTAPKRMNPPPVGTLLQGPNVSVVVEPEKPIRGTVKDADSGKGVPNRVVRLEQRDEAMGSPFLRTKTDAQGRFEFRGAHKAKTYSLLFKGDSSAGYLPTHTSAADTVGYAPLNVDLRVKKGVIVTGKIIDKASGKAVSGFAQFEILVNNPFTKDYPGVWPQRHNTAADGAFRVVTIPGPVLLMGGYYPPSKRGDNGPVVLMNGYHAPEKGGFDYIEFSKYRDPVADPEYPQYFAKLRASRRKDAVGYVSGGGIGLIQGNFCKVLDIKPGTAVVHQDLFLERASVFEVKIQDADRRPVKGVWATDFATIGFIGPLWIERSTCPVYGLEQRKSRLLIFYEPRRKIIGSQKLQGDEKAPLVVELGPMGAIKGRVLDSDGKPLEGAVVTAVYRDGEAGKMHRLIHNAKQSVTDAQGAFTLDELIPELKFELTFRRGKRPSERETKPKQTAIQVKPGECRDLGAIKVKPSK